MDLPPPIRPDNFLRILDDTRSVFFGCLGIAGCLFSSVFLSSLPTYQSYICRPRPHKENPDQCPLGLLYSLVGHVIFIVLTWLAKHLGHVYRENIVGTAIVRSVYTWTMSLMSAYAGSFFTVETRYEPLKWVITLSFTHLFWLALWNFDDDLGLEDAITAVGLSLLVRIPEHAFQWPCLTSLLGVSRHWIPVIRLWATRRPWVTWILPLARRTLNVRPHPLAHPVPQPVPQLNPFNLLIMSMLRRLLHAQPHRLLPAPGPAHPRDPQLYDIIQIIRNRVLNALAQPIVALQALQNIEEFEGLESRTRDRQNIEDPNVAFGSSTELALDMEYVQSESSSVFLTPRQSVEEGFVVVQIDGDETENEEPRRRVISWSA